MRLDPIELFDNGSHKCLCFDSLVTGDGVQSNQFLIIDHDEYLLFDPGGDLTYTPPLSLELSRCIPLQDLTYIFASHQDPDIIAALDKWLLHTRAQVICSKLWARFLPHLTAGYLSISHNLSVFERIIPLPDRGQSFRLGRCTLMAVPAHFLHSVGNFQLYDPVSRISFRAIWAPHSWIMRHRSRISRLTCPVWSAFIDATWPATRPAGYGQAWSGK